MRNSILKAVIETCRSSETKMMGGSWDTLEASSNVIGNGDASASLKDGAEKM